MPDTNFDEEERKRREAASAPATPLPSATETAATGVPKPAAALPADEAFSRYQATAPDPTVESAVADPIEPPAPKTPAGLPEGVDPFDETTHDTPEKRVAAVDYLRTTGATRSPQHMAAEQERFGAERQRIAERTERERVAAEEKAAREAEAARKKENTTAVRQMAAEGVETRIEDDGRTVPVIDEATGRPKFKEGFAGSARFDETTKAWVRDWRKADGTTEPVDLWEQGDIDRDSETGELYLTEGGKRVVVGKDEQFLRRKAIGNELRTIDRDNTAKRLEVEDLQLNRMAPVKETYDTQKKSFDAIKQRADSAERLAKTNPKWINNRANAQLLEKVRAERDRVETEFRPVREQYEGAKSRIDELKRGMLEAEKRQLGLYRERDTIEAAKQRPQFSAPAAPAADETPDETTEREAHGIGGSEWQVPDLATERHKLNEILQSTRSKMDAAGGPTLANLGQLDARKLGEIEETRAQGRTDIDRQTARVAAIQRYDATSNAIESEVARTEEQRNAMASKARKQQEAALNAMRAGSLTGEVFDRITARAENALRPLDEKIGKLRERQMDERKRLKTGLDGQRGTEFPASLVDEADGRVSVAPQAVGLRVAGRAAFLHQSERAARGEVLDEIKREGRITHVGEQTIDEAIRENRRAEKTTLADILDPAEAQAIYVGARGDLPALMNVRYRVGIEEKDGKIVATRGPSVEAQPDGEFLPGQTLTQPVTPTRQAVDFFGNLTGIRSTVDAFPTKPKGRMVNGVPVPEEWGSMTPWAKGEWIKDRQAEEQSKIDERDRDKRSWVEKLQSIGSSFMTGLASVPTGLADAAGAVNRLRSGAVRAGATLLQGDGIDTAMERLFSARPADAEWLTAQSELINTFWSSGIDDRDRDTISSQLAQGLGSAVGFSAAGGVVGVAGRAAGAGAKSIQVAQTATAAMVGAGTNGGASYREAIERGDTDGEAFARFAVGAGLGTTEAVGIGNIMSRLNRFTGGSLKRYLLEVGREGLEEGAQEALQTAGMELFDALNGEKNGIDLRTLEGWKTLGGRTLEAGQVAALTGLIYSAGMGGVAKYDERSRTNRGKRAYETLDAKSTALAEAARSPEGLEAFNARMTAAGGKGITMATAIDLHREVTAARSAQATNLLLPNDDLAGALVKAIDGTADAAKTVAEIRNRPELAAQLVEIGRQAGPALMTPEARSAIQTEQGPEFTSPEGAARRRLLAGRVIVDTHLRGALEGKPVNAAVGQALEDMGLLVRRELPALPDGTPQTMWVVSAAGIELMPGSVREAVRKSPENFNVTAADTAEPGRVTVDLERAGNEQIRGALKVGQNPKESRGSSDGRAADANPTVAGSTPAPASTSDTTEESGADPTGTGTPAPASSGPSSNDNLQFALPKVAAEPIRAFGKSIPDTELYTEEEGFGREEDTHVTLLYGPNQPSEKIQAAVASLGPVEMTLGKVSIFSGEKYDVVKVDVTGDSLKALHKKLKAKFGTASEFKDYKPHVTIAYVKKGEGAKYVGDARFEGRKISLDQFDHSDRDNKKTPIRLGSGKASPSHRVTVMSEPDAKGFRRKRVVEVTAADTDAATDAALSQVGAGWEATAVTQIVPENRGEIDDNISGAAAYDEGDGQGVSQSKGSEIRGAGGSAAQRVRVDGAAGSDGGNAPGDVAGAVRTEGGAGDAGSTSADDGGELAPVGPAENPESERRRGAEGIRRAAAAVSGIDSAVSALNRALNLTGTDEVRVVKSGVYRAPHASFQADGRIDLVINQLWMARHHAGLAAKSDERANRWLEDVESEELIHIADAVAIRERWRKSGAAGSALEYGKNERKALTKDLVRLLDQSVKNGDFAAADRFGLGILSAYANYFGPEAGDLYRDARDNGEAARNARALLVDVANGRLALTDEDGNLVTVGNFAFTGELVRTLVQLQRSGTTTEIGVAAFLEKMKARLQQVLENLRLLADSDVVRKATRRVHEILDLIDGKEPVVTPGPEPDGGLPVLRNKAAEAFAKPADELGMFIRGEHPDQPRGARRMTDADLLDLAAHFDRLGDERRERIVTRELGRRATEEDAGEALRQQRAESWELLDAIKTLGGLPTASEQFRGEIATLRESRTAKMPGLFRNNAPGLDRLALDLAGYGFTFDTADDLLNALGQRLADGGQRQFGGRMELNAQNPGATNTSMPEGDRAAQESTGQPSPSGQMARELDTWTDALEFVRKHSLGILPMNAPQLADEALREYKFSAGMWHRLLNGEDVSVELEDLGIDPAHANELADALLETAKVGKIPESLTLFRADTWMADQPVGAMFDARSVVSTSLAADGVPPATGRTVKIIAPKGTSGVFVPHTEPGFDDQEVEWLLPRGTKFQVIAPRVLSIITAPEVNRNSRAPEGGATFTQNPTASPEINRLLAKQRSAGGLTRAEQSRLDELEAAAGQASLFGDETRVAAPAADLVLEQQTVAAPRADQGMLFAQAPAVDTPAFREWSEGAPLIEPEDIWSDYQGGPAVFRLFHGTTANFTTFDRERANPESDFGAGFYFSNTTDDVGENYAGVGPDLESKIQRAAERIAGETDREYNDPEVVAEARSLFVEHGGATMPAYVRLLNPAVVGGENETTLTFEEVYDEDADEYSDPTGTLVSFIDALRNTASRFEDGDAEPAIEALQGEGYYGGVPLSRALEILKETEGFSYYTDENGELASNEIIRQALERSGFDGIVDFTVDQKFGSQRRIGKRMAGMREDTVHVIAFEPTQIKSAIGNRGTFDRYDSNILNAQNPIAELADSIPDEVETVSGRAEMREMPVEARRLAMDGMRRAEAVANYFGNIPGVDMDELRAEARFANIRAARLFDPMRGVEFATFARRVVENRMISLYRRALGVPDGVSLDEELPSGIPREEVVADATATTADEAAARGETQRALREAIGALPPRMQVIVNGRLAGRTQAEIGDELGIDAPAVSRGESQAMERIRRRLTERGFDRVGRDGVLMAGMPDFTAENAKSTKGIPQTETPEFKAWFGESKVVDADGKPLVVYHGTSQDFRAFDSEVSGARGFYFAKRPDFAGSYANRDGGRIVPVFLSIQNPISESDFYKLGTEEGLSKSEAVQEAKQRGFDGIIGERSLVAFDSAQIKSATGNSGAFDPENPSILETSDPLRQQQVWDELIDETVPAPSWSRERAVREAETVPTELIDTETTTALLADIERIGAEMAKEEEVPSDREDAPNKLRDLYNMHIRGRYDRLDYFAPGAGVALRDSEREGAFAAAAMREWKDGLETAVKEAFGYPSWWRKPVNRVRLAKFRRDLLPYASYLNAVAVDAEGNLQFEDFWQRSGEMKPGVAKQMLAGRRYGEAFRHTDGKVYRIGRMQHLYRGEVVTAERAEELRSQKKKVDVFNQVEVFVSAADQQRIHARFHEEFPEGGQFLDQFIAPDGGNEVVVSAQGVELPAFNRHSLYNYYGSTPLGLVAKIPGYTPDVVRTRGVAGTAAALLKLDWKSPGRNYKTGQARVSGLTRDLLEGFSIRAAQAHMETQRRKSAEALLRATMQPIPDTGMPDDFARVDRALMNQLIRAYNEWSRREGDQTSLPLLTTDNRDALTEANIASLTAIFGDPALFDPNQMIHRVVKEELMRSFVNTHLENAFLDGVVQWVRGSVGGLIASPFTIANNKLSNYLFHTLYAAQRTAYAAYSLAAGERMEAKQAIREAGRLMTGFFTNFYHKDIRDRVNRMMPPELFEDQNALKIAIGDAAGKSPGELLNELNVSGAILRGVGYGEMDIHSKQKLAVASLLSRASIAADDAGITGKERKAWMHRWAENAPVEARRAAEYAARLYMMDYGNVPYWLDEKTPVVASGINLTPVVNLVRAMAIPFWKYPYNYLRQMKRLSYSQGLKQALAKDATKQKRLEAVANMTSLAMLVTLFWLLARPWDPDDEEEIIGRDVADTGEDMDFKYMTGGRVRAARSSVLGMAVRTAARMFGQEDDGTENWVRVRTIPYASQTLFLGSTLAYLGKTARGEEAAAANVGQSAWAVADDFLSVGTGAQMAMATLGFEDKYSKGQTLGYVLGGGGMDLLSGRVLPPQMLRDVANAVDPYNRRRTPTATLDYGAGIIDGAVSRMPWLRAMQPPSGKVQANASPDSETTLAARAELAAMGLEDVAYREYLNKDGILRAAYVRPEYIYARPGWVTGVRQLGANVKTTDVAEYAMEAAGIDPGDLGGE